MPSPCPSCNKNDMVELSTLQCGRYFYRCLSCEIDWTPCETPEEALKAWDTRPREFNDLDSLEEILRGNVEYRILPFIDKLIDDSVRQAIANKEPKDAEVKLFVVPNDRRKT